MSVRIDFDRDRLNPVMDDELTLRLITDKNIRELELDLFTAKWFDYRHLTPLEATRVYIQSYGVIYRQKYEQHMDALIAENISVDTFDKLMLDLENPKKATKTRGKISSYWRGRQFADALCMPYDLYIDNAIEYRLRYWKQRHLPKPGHLYGDMVLEKVQARWEEIQEGRIYLAEHPMYLAQNYCGLPHQDDYHEWIFFQSTKRADPNRFLARMIHDHILPEEKVRGRVSDDALVLIEQHLIEQHMSDIP